MWELLASQRSICIEPGGIRTDPKPRALLPGSFNPLHHGHTTLAAVAAAKLGVPVHFELSISNVDKPELPLVEIERRLEQFTNAGPVWVTRAATFVEKVELFPGAAFVLGWDTAVRLIDSKYYDGERGRDAALAKLRSSCCKLVVGGRRDVSGRFRVWEMRLPAEFEEMFLPLTEADFRVDVSSTELRH